MDKKNRVESKMIELHELKWSFTKEDLIHLLQGLTLHSNLTSGNSKIAVSLTWEEDDSAQKEELKNLIEGSDGRENCCIEA